jgi:hypothetical protein
MAIALHVHVGIGEERVNARRWSCAGHSADEPVIGKPQPEPVLDSCKFAMAMPVLILWNYSLEI